MTTTARTGIPTVTAEEIASEHVLRWASSGQTVQCRCGWTGETPPGLSRGDADARDQWFEVANRRHAAMVVLESAVSADGDTYVPEITAGIACSHRLRWCLSGRSVRCQSCGWAARVPSSIGRHDGGGRERWFQEMNRAHAASVALGIEQGD